MTTYARLSQDKLALDSLVDLTAQQLAALAPWKQSFLRLYVVDAQPVPSASQKVVDGVPLIDATTYHKTWALANKTQAELDADNVTANRAQIKAALAVFDAGTATSAQVQKAIAWLIRQTQ